MSNYSKHNPDYWSKDPNWNCTCAFCVGRKKLPKAKDPKGYKEYVKPEPSVKKSVLEEATELIYGDRQKAYGSALEQYTKLAELWSALVGVKITAEQAVLMMAGLKLVRAYDQVPDPDKEGLTQDEKDKHRDSVVDLAGYAGVLGKIEEERGWW